MSLIKYTTYHPALLAVLDGPSPKRTALIKHVDILLKHSHHQRNRIKIMAYNMTRETVKSAMKMKRQSRRSELEAFLVMHNLDDMAQPRFPSPIGFGMDPTQNIFYNIAIYVPKHIPNCITICVVLPNDDDPLQLKEVIEEEDDPKLFDAPIDSTNILQTILDSVEGFESLRALKI